MPEGRPHTGSSGTLLHALTHAPVPKQDRDRSVLEHGGRENRNVHGGGRRKAELLSRDGKCWGEGYGALHGESEKR